MASYLGLQCLSVTLVWDSRLKWVNWALARIFCYFSLCRSEVKEVYLVIFYDIVSYSSIKTYVVGTH